MCDKHRTGIANGLVTTNVIGVIMRIDNKPYRFMTDFPDGFQ